MVESLKLQLTDLNKNMREEEDKLYKKGRERLLFLGTHGAPRNWTGAETNQYERIISEEDRCRSNIINNKDTKKKIEKELKETRDTLIRSIASGVLPLDQIAEVSADGERIPMNKKEMLYIFTDKILRKIIKQLPCEKGELRSKEDRIDFITSQPIEEVTYAVNEVLTSDDSKVRITNLEVTEALKILKSRKLIDIKLNIKYSDKLSKLKKLYYNLIVNDDPSKRNPLKLQLRGRILNTIKDFSCKGGKKTRNCRCKSKKK